MTNIKELLAFDWPSKKAEIQKQSFRPVEDRIWLETWLIFVLILAAFAIVACVHSFEDMTIPVAHAEERRCMTNKECCAELGSFTNGTDPKIISLCTHL